MTIDLRDQAYAGRSARNVLDLMVPTAPHALPLVVFIHGGAFRMGDKQDNAIERQRLVDSGFAVASVNYRFSTDAIWPAQLDDLRDAFAYLRANAERYGIDPSRVASFGPSAGGHLSASCGVALSTSDETRLRASIVWYPPIDFPEMDADIEATGVPRATGRNDVPDSPESVLIGATVADNHALARSASALGLLDELPAATPLPAFLIMHGALDPFIAARQSRRLHAALDAFGTSPRLELEVLPEGTHGGGDFEKPETMTKVIGFLRETMA